MHAGRAVGWFGSSRTFSSDLQAAVSVGVPLLGVDAATAMFSFPFDADHVEVVEYGDHDYGGEKGEQRAEDPEEQGHPGVEEPVPHEVEREPSLQDLSDVVPSERRRQPEAVFAVLPADGARVDEEAR